MLFHRKLFLFLLLSVLWSCHRFIDKEYHNPINTIECIRHKIAYGSEKSYGSIEMTLEKYIALNEVMIASFMYKNKKASIKLDFDTFDREVTFVSLGDQSDYFVYAIAKLFEEETHNPKMKERLTLPFYAKGMTSIDLFDKGKDYRVFHKPNPENYKGSVAIRMSVDLEAGKIHLSEKNGGIAKKNFIKAFKKPL